MICNNACPVMASKVLNDLSTAKLLIDVQVLSVCHFIIREATYTISIMHYLQSMFECTKHIGNDYCPLRNVCKGCLESRRNSDWRKV
jgi:hypothetical protein